MRYNTNSIEGGCLRKGFTLIELLVVVAIIGILVAIVMTLVSPARGKAKDSVVSTDLGQIKNLAESWYVDHGNSYADGTTNFCADPEYKKLAEDMIKNGAPSSAPSCQACGPTYAVSTRMNTGKTWCVDSTGFNGNGLASSCECVEL